MRLRNDTHVIINKSTKNSTHSAEKLGFFIGTKKGLVLITILGVIIYYLSYKSDDIIIGFIRLVGVGDKWLSDIQAFIRFFGETFISAGIISLIMSIHTIQETHQKVRDNLLLEILLLLKGIPKKKRINC